MKYYNLDYEQALHWPLDIFLAMMEQPPLDYNEIDDISKFKEFPRSQYAMFIKNVSELERNYIHIKLPFSVGDKVGFRETWGEEWEFDKEQGCFVLTGSYIYKSDNPAIPRGGWHSPATMPSEAIRKWCKVVDVNCKRMQELTIAETEYFLGKSYSILKWKNNRIIISKNTLSNCENAFIDWFNAKYKRRGYTYESNPYTLLIGVKEIEK